MKLQILKENLENGVLTVYGFIPAKTTLPILGNIAIEAQNEQLIFRATDLDISIKTGAPCTILEEGAITVPGKKFAEIVRELPNTLIDIELENDIFTIKSERGIYKILGVNIEEFPIFPEIKEEKHFEIDLLDIKRMIIKTIYAVSTDESHPELNGIFWQIFPEETRMVATDGRRLSKIVLEKSIGDFEESIGIIIPPKALSYITKLNPASDEDKIVVYLDKNYIIFEYGSTVIFSRLIDAIFPDYEQFIPLSNDKTLIVDKDMFTSALKRISILSNAQNHQIALNLAPESIKINANTPDIGEGAEDIS